MRSIFAQPAASSQWIFLHCPLTLQCGSETHWHIFYEVDVLPGQVGLGPLWGGRWLPSQAVIRGLGCSCKLFSMSLFSAVF